MIRMVQSSSAGQAKAYFTDALLKSDYYLDDQELKGRFVGKVAERLGICGSASKETFFALCENRKPLDGQPLTPRTKVERTTGYDINFHCPKSVSIVHVLSKDNHILELFESSVTETMKDIEKDAQTRVRKEGEYRDRTTGEMIWSEFTHQTARPVDGSVPDPHLHSHCFTFNTTWDSEERRFKAGQFRNIKRDMPYYQAVFHKRLADKLTASGYRIRKTAKSFEIEGVPQRAIDLFSKRTDEIGRFAKENNITDAKALGELGARTRSRKQKGLGMDELKAIWRKQLVDLGGHTEEEKSQAIRFAPKKERNRLIPEQCVSYAIKHSFERASVMPERRILETALKYSVGHEEVSLEDIAKSFNADGRIIRIKDQGRSVCTTREVLAEEKKMVDLARQGQGKMNPLYKEIPQMELEGQQAEAVAHVLTTTHRVSIIRGAAGSGKTTLMKTAVGLMEQAGKKVTVIAPTAEASKGVLVDDGFSQADTVAKLLVDKRMQAALQDQILWVDEAGLLGTKDMHDLLELTKQKNARLILGGDTRQHASVVRGDALRILNTVAGIRTAEVSKIYRQRDFNYREAVEHFSKGNIKEGFEKLEAIGSIKAVDPMKPNEQLVTDYVAFIKKGKTALVISPTHKQGDDVTDAIRMKLKDAKLIGKKEVGVLRLINLNLTNAQKTDWRNYKEGQVVQFSQNVPKISRGSVWKVKDIQDKSIVLQNQQDEEINLPSHRSECFDVYEQSNIKLAKGDKVKITKNGFDGSGKRLNNGQALEVVSVSSKGNIVLRNNASKATYSINADHGHISHAHCITSHAAQGKTVDHVLVSQPAATFTATDAKQFYVSASRGRESASIYTDDKDELLDHAARMGDRQSAIELVHGKDRHMEQVKHYQREIDNTPAVTKDNSKTVEINKQRQDIEYEPGI